MITEFEGWLGFGKNGKAELWMKQTDKAITPIHIALVATTRAEVDGFYKSALAAGGKDNGAPGLRPEYHEHYYGAFVIDPNGHNIEAVCHKPLS